MRKRGMNIKNARENRENSEVLLGPKGKTFQKKVQSTASRPTKKQKKMRTERDFGSFFFTIIQKAVGT